MYAFDLLLGLAVFAVVWGPFVVWLWRQDQDPIDQLKKRRKEKSKNPAVPFVAETMYTIPRIGEHPRLLCVVGRHWWTLMRDGRTKTPLGVLCGACRKQLHVHDKVDTPSTPPSIRNQQRK